MATTMDSLFKQFIFLVVIFSIADLGVESQSSPCMTPMNRQGLCVPINRCQNIFRIVNSNSSKPVPARTITYIKQAACTLPNVERSVCCQPAQVEEEVPQPVLETRFDRDLLLPGPEECGLSVNDRIAYGDATEVFAYPWMAVLQYSNDKSGDLEDNCGGSLINKRYVLTAAHCLKTKSAIRLAKVVLGEHTKNQEEDCNIYRDKSGNEIERDCAPPPEEYEIESFVYHPKYNHPRFCHDIGLIRLKKDVVMNDHIKPVCLPVTPELRTLKLDKYTATGWGFTENKTVSQVLLQATMPRVDNPKCQEILNSKRMNVQLTDAQFCAGGQDRVDSCRGDSGGPVGLGVLYNTLTRFVQFGVVAAGVGSCGETSIPGIYSRVSSHMDWILETIRP